MLEVVKLEDAVGRVLAHDITEIRPGCFKGAAFKRRHTIRETDICRLQRRGTGSGPTGLRSVSRDHTV